MSIIQSLSWILHNTPDDIDDEPIKLMVVNARQELDGLRARVETGDEAIRLIREIEMLIGRANQIPEAVSAILTARDRLRDALEVERQGRIKAERERNEAHAIAWDCLDAISADCWPRLWDRIGALGPPKE